MRLPGLLAATLLAPLPTPEGQIEPLTGRVWWDDPSTGGGCAEWSFVPQEWGVSLERSYEERGEGWRREVRVFYNLTTEPGTPTLYAPGWEYRWIEDPGPDAGSMPGMRGAMGYVSGFCLHGYDRRQLVWSEAHCAEINEQTPRQTWYRRRRDCTASR